MKRSAPIGLTGVALFVALAALVSGSALAYFTTSGTGNASAGVSKLTAPTVTATPAAGGTVVLSWGAVTAPGPGIVTYKVTRDGKDAGGGCPTVLTSTTCTDDSLAPGTYSYAVTAKWRSWTAVSSVKTAQVAVGPIHHFTLAAASSTPTAGATDNLTITAKDEDGSTVTTYTGAKSLTFSGASAGPDGTVPTVSDFSGSEIAFGNATTIAFTAGVASVSSAKNGAMKLYKSGAAGIGVSDGSVSTETPLAVTVSAATAAKLVLAAGATTVAAGEGNNLTVTAQDTYGNVATSYTGSKSLTFSGASASPGGTQPTVVNSGGTAVNFGSATSISFSAGVATVSSSKNGLMRLYASGQPDIDVSDGSISTKTPLEVTVSPLAASKFVLTAATTTPAAGAVDNLTVTAQDTYGNVATSYTGSKSLTYTGASASPNGTTPTVSDSSGADVAFGTAAATEFTAGVASVSGTSNGAMKLYKPGSTNVKVSDGTFSVTLTVTVSAAAASQFTLAAASTTPVAAAANNLTITALDPYGNTATSYTGAHELVFSGSSASPNGTLPSVIDNAGATVDFGSPTAINFSSGVAKVASSKNGVMKLSRAGAASIAVSEGAITNPTPLAVTVSPGSAARWGITNINVSAGTLGPNCLFACTLTGLGNSGTVTARVAIADSVGNTVSGVGKGRVAKVTTNGSGTISGTPLTIPSSGAAESATSFTFTSKSSGGFTETLTVATSSGTTYTAATLTASK